jgi:hypothetical protein
MSYCGTIRRLVAGILRILEPLRAGRVQQQDNGTRMPRSRPSSIRRRPSPPPPPPGKHAHVAPRLIGFSILALAALLVMVGVATA